jgi:transketolase
VRRTILAQSKRANVGHIGSALSVVDLLSAIYEVLDARDPGDRQRDRLVLSKGHAALALYATLNATGRLSDETLASFCRDGSALATHPEHVVPWIDFSTGSLGHGLSIGAGCALAARLQRSGRRTYVLLSDAECNEGSVWEAVMFAAHHKLDNLIAVVDSNGQQALGYTCDVLDLAPLSLRWEAFGWAVETADGHDREALGRALARNAGPPGRPRAVLAETTFGKGVSYMESQIAWHYMPMSDAQYAQALEELERA